MIFTNVPTPGFVPVAGDGFAWATRCGAGIAETFRIDNINVTAVMKGPPAVQVASTAPVPLRPQIKVSAIVETGGAETTVTIQAGTNLSYAVGVTNVLSSSEAATPLTATLTLDTERSMPIYVHLVASNAYGTVSTNLVTQSTSFEGSTNQFLEMPSAFVWADMNDDGFLDFMAAGATSMSDARGAIYLNRGTASNRWATTETWSAIRAFIAPGDYDNDNRPDLFCVSPAQVSESGASGFNAAILYGVASNHAVQLGRATQMLFFPFHLDEGRALARDFDHDGRQDILLSGVMSPYSGTFFTNAPDPGVVSGKTSRLLRNEFGGVRGGNMSPYFRIRPANLSLSPSVAGVAYWDAGYISAGELDGDGFADVYVAGVEGANANNQGWALLHGDGEMGFQSLATGNRGILNFPVASSASLWADFNGDGHEDLLVSEGTLEWGTNLFTQILLNNGQGQLTNSGWTLPQVSFAAIAAGDLFNHGRNDIVLVGANADTSGPHLFRILKNQGNGVFTPIDCGFPDDLISNQGTGGLELADYDKDGRLDIGHSLGQFGFNWWEGLPHSVSVYRNELDIPSNAPPQAPVNLSAVISPGTVTFHWGSAADDITPTNLLTYNLRVGTNSLGTSVVSPLANVTNGWRKVTGPGNCRHIFSTLYRLPPGTYFWSVQAVDGAYAGGAWAAEQTFTITEAERPKLALAGNNAHWPARFSDYGLEQASALTGSNWTSVAQPAFYDDGKLKVLFTNEPPFRFFRLRKP